MKILGLALAIAGGLITYLSVTGKNIKDVFKIGQ